MRETSGRQRRATYALLVAVTTLVLVQPAAASAATAGVSAGKLLYSAAPGEASNLTIVHTQQGAPSGPVLQLIDRGASIEPGVGCTRVSRNVVRCAAAGLRRVVVRGADRDDKIVDNAGMPSTLVGGPGEDTILGGSSADDIWGGPGRDRLSGRGGDDQIHTRGNVADSVSCGAGLDTAWVDALDRFTHDCESIIGLPAVSGRDHRH